MRFFLDGHSRIYVDDDAGCGAHRKKDPPLFHVARRYVGTRLTDLLRCPKSLSPEERSRLKESK